MILRNDRPQAWRYKRLAVLAGIGVLAGVVLLIGYRQLRNKWWKGALLACDMETVAEHDNAKFFVANTSEEMQNGQTQSDEFAHNGSYSCKLDSANPFGATYELLDANAGGQYEFSVWRRSADHKGSLIVDASWGLYREAPVSGQEGSDGWEQLLVRVNVPALAQAPRIKVYVYNPHPEAAYFDDFVIREVVPGSEEGMGSNFAQESLPEINLIVSEKGMDKLKASREEALRSGILSTGSEDWVKFKFQDESKEYTGRLRLKGDWTDHLLGDKWSFRLSLDEGMAWRRMVTFSVQSPRARDFLNEWVFHEMLDREDVLTPRYGFIKLSINGVSRGLYAYEEHFDKQIVEYNNRREGPIMKLDEEGLWEVQEMNLHEDMPYAEERVPIYKAANAIPFNAKLATEDSAMHRLTEIAMQLCQQYKTGAKTIWDIFDAPKMARYFALIDLLGAQHGVIWHNQRWYYNPIIGRLEPIGFDGYTEYGPYLWIERPFIGYARNVRYMSAGYREFMFERFFHDRKFLELYVHALQQYTSTAFLDDFFGAVSPQLNTYESWLQMEWKAYRYNRTFVYDRAKSLRLQLLPLKHSSVKAHLQGKTPRGYHYRVYNYHCLPVVLEGVGEEPGAILAPFDADTMIDAYNNEFPAEYLDVYSEAEGKLVFFSVPGIDSVLEAEVLPWAEPTGMTPEQELFTGLKISTNGLYEVDEATKRVTFKTGKYKTSSDVLIPKGYQVWFQKGVTLDLVGRAKFISKSPVLMFGTEEQPILVTSSDRSANGFTVLQAPTKSEFRYAVFDNLGTLAYKGWNLTGAVTLYESEVLFEHCRFVNNHCEDALNTVRCVFTFNSSYVGYTQGDGFDSDFCNGTLTNASFSNTGNDCIDFSGSVITIVSATIDHAGDKGISLGEECRAVIQDATVRNSVIGVAAKDLTQVTIKNITLQNNKQAFAAYQKKPEYGPATIVVEKYTAEGNGELHFLQAGSKLTIDGQTIEGKR